MEFWSEKSICEADFGVIQVTEWKGPHPLNAGIYLILSVYMAVIFSTI